MLQLSRQLLATLPALIRSNTGRSWRMKVVATPSCGQPLSGQGKSGACCQSPGACTTALGRGQPWLLSGRGWAGSAPWTAPAASGTSVAPAPSSWGCVLQEAKPWFSVLSNLVQLHHRHFKRYWVCTGYFYPWYRSNCHRLCPMMSNQQTQFGISEVPNFDCTLKDQGFCKQNQKLKKMPPTSHSSGQERLVVLQAETCLDKVAQPLKWHCAGIAQAWMVWLVWGPCVAFAQLFYGLNA